MKKLIALLLCLVMIVSVLAGCGPTAPTGNNNDDTGSANNNNGDTLPDDIVLTIGIPQSGRVEDYDTNAYTLWLEEATGYDLQFQVYQGGNADYKSQLSVAMVDGEELPDILMNFNLGTGVYEEYGEDGYFIDLTPYFEDKEGKSKVWWDRFEQLENKEWQDYIWNKMVAGVDGGIYAFPRLESSPYDVMAHQMFINQDWLDKLGLPMPTDVDSFYETLKAFKTKDPNGNGKADEVCIIGVGTYGDVLTWLINMFVYNNNNRFWRVDDQGQLYHIYASDEYREALKFVNKLVKEGLLPTSIWSSDGNAVKSMLAPGDGVQTVGIFAGHPTMSLSENNDNIYSYKAMPYWGYVTLNDQFNQYNTFITEDCEYPDAAWNLLMTMASEEGSYRMRYGEKEIDWVDADPDTVSYLNKPATLKIINESAYSDMGNQCWGDIIATILLNAENEVCQLSDDMSDWLKYKMGMMRDCFNNYYEAAERNPDNVIGNLDYSVEEEEHIKISEANTKSFINSCKASFCTGTGKEYNDPNNDAQWEAYLKGIEAQDIATWQSTAQEVYDWQYAGK